MIIKNRILGHIGRLALLTIFLQLCFIACQKNEGEGGVPVITHVRVPDPELADSTFNKAYPGTLLAIMGRNLQRAIHVYINDQDVYFNSTQNTDHSIIVTIPSESDGFVLTPWDEALKDEIRVETVNGVATYAFKVLSPGPIGQRVAGAYPRVAGDKLQFYGENLVDILRVFFTDISLEELEELDDLEDMGGTQVEVTDYTVTQNRYQDESTEEYITESLIEFTLPSLPYDAGLLVVECEAGFAYAEYAKLPPAPRIMGISSDMPVPGEPVVLQGANFIQVEEVRYADVVIPGGQLEVAESEDQLVFIMEAVPVGESAELTVVTPGGEASLTFWQRESVLLDFDGRGVDNGWAPNATFLSADGVNPPYTSDGNFGLINVQDNGSNWWGTMIYWKYDDAASPFVLPGYDLIPADTPAEEVCLAVEVYNIDAPFVASAFIHYLLETNEGNTEWANWDYGVNDYYEPVLQDADGETPLNRWYRAVLPMSYFPLYAGKTYADIVASGIKQIRLMDHNYTSTPMLLNVCFDNVRIIRLDGTRE